MKTVKTRILARGFSLGAVVFLSAGALVSCSTQSDTEEPVSETGSVLGRQLSVPTWTQLEATPESYPFGSDVTMNAPVDLTAHGYVEREYLVSGKAHVYEALPDTDFDVEVLGESEYTTRAIVRLPEASEDWSGRVIIEYMNVSDGLDIQVAWSRLHSALIENGDAYIGFTGKANVFPVLERFDKERYGELGFENPVPIDEQLCGALPGDANYDPNLSKEHENGVLWDMWNQLALSSRAGSGPLPAEAETVIAYGESQSSIAMLNLHRWFGGDRALTAEGETLFDGYLDEDSVGSVALDYNNEIPFLPLGVLNQCSEGLPQDDEQMHLTQQPDRSVPYFGVHSQFGYWPEGRTSAKNYRDWTITGASHVDRDLFAHLYPSEEDLERAGVLGDNRLPGFDWAEPKALSPESWQCPAVPEATLAVGIRAAYESLLKWVEAGAEPPVSEALELDENGELRLDQGGNAIGGLRLPALQAPIATYTGARWGNCAEFVVPFDENKIAQLYSADKQYEDEYAESVQTLVRDDFITDADARELLKQSISRD